MYEELYQENRGLLRLVAWRYAAACQRDRAVSVEDLTQAGFFGLIQASKTFDPDKGSWATWAAWAITDEIYKALGLRDGKPTKAHTCALSLDAPQNEQQRLVIQICGLEGKPYEAAAAALGVSAERVRQIRGRALERLRKDKALRDDARADIADIEARTPYYTRVTVTSFNRSHTSATERAVLWRLEQEQRRAAQIERLKRIEQELTEKEALYREKMGETGKGGTVC